MKRKLFLLAFVVVQFFALTAMAAPAKRTLKGVVEDDTGEPLIGATIQVEGTSTGVSADMDGNFQIQVADGQTLLVTYIGYTPQSIKITSATKDLKVVMRTNEELLEDVVVIGYGAMKKKDLTGSITQIDPSKIADSNPANVQDLLRGTAGLQIGYDSSAKGGGSIELRGKNSLGTGSSPLIILDGMQFYGELSEINPDDIKQIDILKDSSSAAIYGAKAANGVIIITTKRGNNSGQPTVTLSANWGINTKSAYRKMYDADGYIAYRSDWYKRETYGFDENGNWAPYQKGQTNVLANGVGYYDSPYGLSAEDLDTWLSWSGNSTDDNLREVFGSRIDLNKNRTVLDNYVNNRTFDWYNYAFRTGLNQDYNVSLSGGTDKMNYYLSFGYLNNEGVIKGNDYSAIRSSMRISGKVTSWLEIGGNANFQNRTDGDVTMPTGSNYWDANNLRFSPYSLLRDPETGELNFYPQGDDTNRGDVYSSYDFREQYHKMSRGYTVLNSKFYANLTLPYGISYQFNISPRFEYYYNREFWSADLPYVDPKTRGVNRNWQKKYDYSLNNTINWDYTFNDKHHFMVTLAQECEERRAWSDYINSRYITPSDALGFHNTQNGDKELSSFGTNDWHSTADALLARLFYSYDNRYMITASVRRDGYSAFGQNQPRATFPSVALAWNVGNEKFFEPIADWWNTAKLRLSWGKNGNRDIGDIYLALANLGSGEGKTQGYVDANGAVSADMKYLLMDRLGNPNLQWERTEAYNIGLDLGFLRGRLNATLEFYYKKTKDMIMGMKLPNFSGFSSITTNIGQVDNKGFELSINSINITKPNFEWTTNFVLSYNDNRIKHINYETEDILDEEGNVIGTREKDDINNGWFIGHPIGTMWGFEVDGIYQVSEAEEAAILGLQPGDPKVKNNYTADDEISYDEDGNEIRKAVYNDKDKKFVGVTRPPLYFQMRNDFTLFKDFLISFTFYSYCGHKSWDGVYLNNDNGGDLITNGINTWEKDYWTPENASNTYARLGAKGPAGATGPSRVLNRNFLRLSDLTFGYTLPQKWTRKAYMEKVRFTFGIKNLFTIAHKNWVYADPENGGLGVRSFNFGVNVTF